MDWFLPVLGTLGIGGFLGWAAATFIKTTGRIVGCIIGLVFILMQVLAYYGIAQWHWDAIGHAIGGFAGGFWWGMKH